MLNYTVTSFYRQIFQNDDVFSEHFISERFVRK